MARPIDEKIVAMKMDNSDFKQKAIETTSIFGKLRDGFSKIPGISGLSKVTQELGNVKRAATNASDFSSLTRAADVVTQRFSNMGIVATTALANIANRATNTGLAIMNSLGPQQVRDGFSEYELKMRSIGTMLANTEWAGSDLNDVKRTLEDLNNYADKTIYNFAQMTDNVGRFTAAGVTLEDSATAIKGLGNLAAISGSDVNQLNTAMYQMSQALASGKLNLMDWNSLVNAGMAGKKTQDALVKTARKMGKTVDLSNGFRDSISKGWLTSKVFLATLKQFGKDKSMTEAATKVRTFTGMMDALKESIGSGWATSWEIIFGDYEEATKFWTKISDTLNGIFQKSTDSRNAMLKAIFDDGGLNSVLESIKNVGTPIVQIFKAIGGGFREAFPPVSVKSIRSMVDGFRDFTSHLKLSESTVNNLKTIFAGFFSTVSIGWKIIKGIGSAFMELLPGLGSLGAGLLSLIAKFFQIPIAFDKTTNSGNALGKVGDFLHSVFNSLGTVIGKIGSGFEYLGDVVGQTWAILGSGKFSGGPFGENSSIVNGLLKVREAFKAVFDYIGNLSLSGVVDWFKSIGDSVANLNESVGGLSGLFQKAFGWLKDNQGWLLAGGGLTGLTIIGFKVFEFFKNLTKPLANVGEVLEKTGEAIEAFTLGIHTKSLLTIAAAVGILAVSFLLLSRLDVGQITTGLYMIVGSLAAMVGALTIMSKFDIGGSFGATAAIVAMAGSMLIMALAVKMISKLNYGQITKGILVMASTLGILSGAIILMSKFAGKGITVSAFQLMGIATSVLMLTGAIAILGNMEVGTITQGLTTITLVLAAIAGFTRLTGKGSAKAGLGILLMAAALNALIIPILAFGKMSIGTIAQGLITMGVALSIIGLAAGLMSGTIAGSIAIGLLAGALMLLVAPIAAFGNMKWGTIIKGVVAVALAMGALGGMALLLAPAVVPLLAFAAAIGILGLAVMAAGAGLSIFAKGLILLAGLGAGAIVAITATVAALITGFATLLPSLTDLALKIVNAVLGVFSRMIPRIVTTIANLLLALLGKIAEYIPQFSKAGTDIVVGLINGFSDNAPRIAAAVVAMINTMADTLAQNGTQFVDAMTRLMGEALLVIVRAGTNMVVALYGWIPGVKTAARKIGKAAEDQIKSNFNAKGTGSQKGKDFADGVDGKSGAAHSAGKKVGNSAKEGAKSVSITPVGNSKGSEFAKGVTDKTGDAKNAGKALGTNAKSGASSVDATSVGTNFGLGFAGGISSGGVMDKVMGAARALGAAAKNVLEKHLDIHSPSRVMRKDGGHFGEGFALGIEDKVKRVMGSARSLASSATDSLNNFLDSFSAPSLDNEFHLKAVIDYDQFDPSKAGLLQTLGLAPNTALTKSLIAATDQNISNARQQSNGQPTDVTALLARMEQSNSLTQQQVEILYALYNKDTSVYLDGKELYNNQKRIENNNVNIRNIFKGVPSY